MDERDWLILKVLYEQKNITKAAQQLFMSQPALTNRLKEIEEIFKVHIAMRGRRGVQFTAQGEYLANCADEMLLKIRKIKENVLNLDTKTRGTLRIGSSKLVAKYTLPRILRLFRDQYPDVDFQVLVSWSRNIPDLVESEEVHVGFLRGEHYWPEEKHKLFEETICIASKDKIELKDLPTLPQINYLKDPLLKTSINNWWKNNYSVQPYISMEVDHVDTCKVMITNGLGYAFLPVMKGQGIEDLYTIDIHNENGEPILRRTWMIYSKGSKDIHAVRAFVDFVKELYSDSGEQLFHTEA